jgi:hypothetical protein
MTADEADQARADDDGMLQVGTVWGGIPVLEERPRNPLGFYQAERQGYARALPPRAPLVTAEWNIAGYDDGWGIDEDGEITLQLVDLGKNGRHLRVQCWPESFEALLRAREAIEAIEAEREITVATVNRVLVARGIVDRSDRPVTHGS